MYELSYPWLLALLPLPLLIWWLLPPYRTEQESLRIPFFSAVVSATGLRPSEGAIVLRTNWLQKIIGTLCWALLVLAAARPQMVEPPIEKIQPARDLMLALDISESMDAKDSRAVDGRLIRRVDAVKQTVADFIRKRKGDRIGLIVFGAAAYPQAPFTLDHTACQTLLEQIDVNMAGPRTMIGDAIGLAIKQFEKSQAEERVLIVLSDGNDTGSRMPPGKAAEIAKQRGITIHTIAMGDPNASGENKVDFSTLENVAKATGGRFFVGSKVAELATIYDTLDRITPHNYKTLTYRPKDPLFMYPLGAATLLIVAFYALMLPLSAWRQRRLA